MKYLFRSLFAFILLGSILGTIFLLTKNRPDAKHENTLNVFVWNNFLSHESLRRFEQESGIHVKLHYYTSNEEMLAKLKHCKGIGYDIIFPSDYAVEVLAKEKFIKPIKKYKVDAFSKIEPFLLNHQFDPGNTYSLPYIWESFFIAVDSERFDIPQNISLGQIFNKDIVNYRIAMTPDPVEAFVLASTYLYKHTNDLTPKQKYEIQNLLRTQKNWVEAYADFRAKHLIATKNCPLVLLRSSYISQAIEQNPDIKFLLPEEGAGTSIESIVLCSSSDKEEASYKLINFLYRPEILARSLDLCPLFPSIAESLDYLENPAEPEFYEALESIKNQSKFFFFNYPIPPDEIREIWLNMKSNRPL